MSDYIQLDLDAMIDEALDALAAGGNDKHPLIEGRIVAVFASPELERSQDMAMGISALPPGYSTPEHSHRAEEFATVMRGTGTITIEGVDVTVGPGSVVVTPPNARHVTSSDENGPLVVYWTYGPAGSEKRWL